MKVINERCRECDGFGFVIKWIVPDDSVHIATSSTEICEECNGEGHTEYVVFSVKEAKAILQHCGLSTES